MATVQLGSKGVGSIVKLKVNGSYRNFIVVHQGLPSSIYDSSCNGTWLLMQDIYEARRFHVSYSDSTSFYNSELCSYLNGAFLNLLDSSIKAAIKQVKIPYSINKSGNFAVSTGKGGFSTKVFLLSRAELHYDSSQYSTTGEGSALSYFASCSAGTDSKRVGKLNGTITSWWVRSPWTQRSYANTVVYTNGGFTYEMFTSAYGVRPALILPTDLCVSDDGTISVNVAPSTPGSISIPSAIDGGSTITISWAGSSDSNGNLSGYILERSVNGGSFSQLYKGSALRYTDTITKGWNTVAYRVKAYDSYSAASGYRTSDTRTVINNTAPTITGGGALGERNEPFAFTYSVADVDGNSLTVTEKLDGKTTKTRTGISGGSSLTFEQGRTEDGFRRILNGTHTITVEVSDGELSASTSATFSKAVHAASVTLTAPLAVEGDITMAVIVVTGSIPADAVFKVKATNNGADPEPVWQDVTTEVLKGLNILFTNKTAAQGAAFNFRVTVSRGPSGEGGYIEAVSGAFQ